MAKYSGEELRLLTQVLPNVALQLRGAMANVYTSASRLASVDAREADTKLDRTAAVFSQSYYQIYRMIGNLTDAAMLAESGLFTLYNAEVVSVFRSLCEKAEVFFADKGVAFAFESDCESAVIAADTAYLERMLLNLLSNALKFTGTGGAVTVRLTADRKYVFLRVSDTGCGISKARMEHVFDRFLDVDRFDPVPHGLGLGLALCRRIAEGHGGSIACKSEEGEGAAFTVTLPNQRSNNVRLREAATNYSGGFDPILIQLSDALGADEFLQKYLD